MRHRLPYIAGLSLTVLVGWTGYNFLKQSSPVTTAQGSSVQELFEAYSPSQHVEEGRAFADLETRADEATERSVPQEEPRSSEAQTLAQAEDIHGIFRDQQKFREELLRDPWSVINYLTSPFFQANYDVGLVGQITEIRDDVGARAHIKSDYRGQTSLVRTLGEGPGYSISLNIERDQTRPWDDPLSIKQVQISHWIGAPSTGGVRMHAYLTRRDDEYEFKVDETALPLQKGTLYNNYTLDLILGRLAGYNMSWPKQ